MATPIEDQLTNNTIRTYYALDEAMLTAHREDRNEYANSTARVLLENPDLPLLIRARACMVLGCSTEPDFLEMAKESVRIAELGFSRCTNPGDTEHRLVAACKKVLKEAQEAFDEMEGEEEEGELVWQAEDEEETATNNSEKSEAVIGEAEGKEEQAQQGPGGKKEKVSRRMHTDPEKVTVVEDDPPPLERKEKRTRDFQPRVEDQDDDPDAMQM